MHDPIRRQRFNHHRVEIKAIVLYRNNNIGDMLFSPFYLVMTEYKL